MKHISAVTQLCCLCSKSNHHPTAENWNRLHLWKWTVYLSVMQNVFKCYSSCHVEIRMLLLLLLILISGKLICRLSHQNYMVGFSIYIIGKPCHRHYNKQYIAHDLSISLKMKNYSWDSLFFKGESMLPFLYIGAQ